MELAERWDRELDGVPGEVSIQLRTADGVPVAGLRPAAPHYAASTMKLAVLVAALTGGCFGPDTELHVHDTFPSALGGTFTIRQADDQDDATWRRLGAMVPAPALLERMIADSGNLATNLVLERLGLDPVRAVHPGVTVNRLIGDQAAEAAGITNTVTAAGLSGLLAALAAGALLPRAATDAALAVLAGQRHRRMIPAGLPPHVWSASKGGWTGAVNHDVALVRPGGAPAYVLAVCTSTGLDADAERLIARLSAVTWAHWTAAA
ncbi:serine hydrolase [Jiangella anatolica]|uniref:Serine hydrolase n=1 Tax=Jiangella anatolica TaxID=2670374 RepID=A0A2W2CEL2_9ACTN|nr:serine hydrolase [Jiangella anatolica]PZF86737.1 serine hydrolase [Jiangella anatolica]